MFREFARLEEAHRPIQLRRALIDPILHGLVGQNALHCGPNLPEADIRLDGTKVVGNLGQGPATPS